MLLLLLKPEVLEEVLLVKSGVDADVVVVGLAVGVVGVVVPLAGLLSSVSMHSAQNKWPA